MADRAIHENGISIKLCELCNSNKDFLMKFLCLFDNIPQKYIQENPIDVDYIYFSGNIETGYGKPDITIRFEDGDFFYIEVKTNANTKFQKTQLSKDVKSYNGLIKQKGQLVENSYAFLLDCLHVYNYRKILKNNIDEIHFVTWNEVLELIETEICDLDSKELLDFKQRLEYFKEELKSNVDGLDTYSDKVSLDEIDYDIFSTPQKIMKYEEILKEFNQLTIDGNNYLELSHVLSTEISKNNKKQVKFIFTLIPSITKDWLPNLGYYVKLKKELEDSKGYIFFDKSIFIGFNISVLLNTNFIDLTNNENVKEDYFFSISIESDLLDINKIRNARIYEKEMMADTKNQVRFCKDKANWCYFPLKDLLKQGESLDIDMLSNLFKTKIHDRLEYIFKNFLPDDTRRLYTK